MVNPLVPSFYYYKFAEAISSPFTSLNAFTAGAIDAQGNILKPESSIDPFEYFVIKLKKIFDQLPYGTTKASLSTYIPALRTFTEEAEKFGITKEQFSFFVEGVFARETNGHVSYFLLNEEMGSANLGGPATSSGYNTGGVSGIDRPMGSGVARRKSVLGFEDSCEMFDVCPEDYIGFSSADAWDKVPDSESKKYIQRYQRSNPNKKMAIRNSDSGEIYFLKLKPRNKNNKNLVEEYIAKLLNEKKLKFATDSYEDDATDKEDINQENIATVPDDLEKEKPIEVSTKELKTTAEILRDRYEQKRTEERDSDTRSRYNRKMNQSLEKGESDEPVQGPIKDFRTRSDVEIPLGGGGAEKYGIGLEYEKGLSVIPEIIKRLGSRGQEIAAQWHGSLRHHGERAVSENEPFDYRYIPSVEEVEQGVQSETPWQDILKKMDIKSTKATNPFRLDPEGFGHIKHGGGIGFPKINGEYAHVALAMAKEAGDEGEYERIHNQVLKPFFEQEAAQKVLQQQFTQKLTKKQQETGSQMALATRPGMELIPLGQEQLDKIARGGFRIRLTRGGTQPVSKSQLSVQTKSNFGMSGVGSQREQVKLQDQNQSVGQFAGKETSEMLNAWLRGIRR